MQQLGSHAQMTHLSHQGSKGVFCDMWWVPYYQRDV